MPNQIRLAQRPRALVKITLSVILVVALFAIINYGRRSVDTAEDEVEDVMKRSGDHGDEDDSEDTDLTASFPSAWSDSHTSPCYLDGSVLKCFPSFFLLGYQFAGMQILKEAIDLHPKIDAYSTNFFAKFHDMEEVQSSDLQEYISHFDSSSEKINSGSADLSICDSGRGLARQYTLGQKHGARSPPHHTQSSLLNHLFNEAKAVVLMREPCQRFIYHFADAGISEAIGDYVERSISELVACESYAESNPAVVYKESCIYDQAFSSILQAGYYDYLNERDLKQHFGDARVKIYKWEVFKNSTARRDMLADLFVFLGKDIPAPESSYWSDVDALFAGIGVGEEPYVPPNVKAMLNDFYSTRASPYYTQSTPRNNAPQRPPLRKPKKEKKPWWKNIFEKLKNKGKSRLNMLRKPTVNTNPFARSNIRRKANGILPSLKQKLGKSKIEHNPFRKVKLKKSKQN